MPVFRVRELSSFQIYKVFKIFYIYSYLFPGTLPTFVLVVPFFSLFTPSLLKSNTNGSLSTHDSAHYLRWK